MKKSPLFFFIFFMSFIAFVISVCYASDITTPKSSKKVKKEETKIEVKTLDIGSLQNRIALLTEVTVSQEKEIQRLSSIIENLKEELKNTTSQLESVRSERDSLAEKLAVAINQLKTIRATISQSDITEVSTNQRLGTRYNYPISPDSLARQQSSDTPRHNQVMPSDNSSPPHSSLSKPQQNDNRAILVIPVEQDQQKNKQSEAKPRATDNHTIADITSDNIEKFYKPLATTAITTGNPVHIQQNGLSITGRPLSQSDKCNAIITISSGKTIVSEKKYNICEHRLDQ